MKDDPVILSSCHPVILSSYVGVARREESVHGLYVSSSDGVGCPGRDRVMRVCPDAEARIRSAGIRPGRQRGSGGPARTAQAAGLSPILVSGAACHGGIFVRPAAGSLLRAGPA